MIVTSTTSAGTGSTHLLQQARQAAQTHPADGSPLAKTASAGKQEASRAQPYVNAQGQTTGLRINVMA
jgi:hypothetical protein